MIFVVRVVIRENIRNGGTWGGGGEGWSSVLSQKSNEICTRAYVKRLKELGDKIYQNSDSGNCYKLSETLKK